MTQTQLSVSLNSDLDAFSPRHPSQVGVGVQTSGLHRGVRQLQQDDPVYEETEDKRRHRLRGLHHQQVRLLASSLLEEEGRGKAGITHLPKLPIEQLCVCQR